MTIPSLSGQGPLNFCPESSLTSCCDHEALMELSSLHPTHYEQAYTLLPTARIQDGLGF